MNKQPQEDNYLGMIVGNEHVEDTIKDFDARSADTDSYNNPELDAALRAQIAKKRNHIKANGILLLIKTAGKRAGVLLLGLCGLFTFLMITVEAFRLEFYNLVFVREDTEHFDYGITYSEQELKNMGFLYLPAYIPEEYSLTGTVAEVKKLTFSNADGEQITYIESYTYDVSIDNESNKEEIVIGGIYNGYIGQKEGKTFIVWNQDGICFFLTGEADPSTLVAIAESIKKLN